MTEYFLGLDWGERKVGVALADAETRMAFGKATLTNDTQLLGKIGDLIREHAVETVVIGRPIRIGQEEGHVASERLGRQIEQAYSVRVVYQDERYTTKMARANLIERGMHGLDQQDDREAARIILQEWLEKK